MSMELNLSCPSLAPVLTVTDLLGADEAEAKQILEKIVTRFPQYRVRKS